MTSPAPSPARTVAGHGGLRLAVHEQGPADRPTVVLVHGYPDTHAVWDLVAERLAGDHHVVAYDVRGAGGSEVPTDRAGYRLAALVEDLAAVAEATAGGRRVHLVGHDWGSIQGWAALAEPEAERRYASFTSMSGPSLDHAAAWMRAHGRPGGGRWRDLLRQGARSWYVAAFQTPFGPLAWQHGLAARWPEAVARREGARVDERWPGPTLEADAVHGVELYRANLGVGAAARTRARTTDVPVRLLVPDGDPFVTPALLDGIEELAPRLERLDVGGGHWLPRSRPDRVAGWIAEHVAAVEAVRPPR